MKDWDLIIDQLNNNDPQLKVLEIFSHMFDRNGVTIGEEVRSVAISIAKAVKENTILTKLDMSSSVLEAEGGIDIANSMLNNSTLSYLKLSGTHLTSDRQYSTGGWGATVSIRAFEAIGQGLKYNNGLVFLDLGANYMNDEAAKHIALAFKRNNTLTHLKLNSNDIKDEGAIAFATNLKNNRSLKTLDLSGNKIGDRGIIALMELLENNKSISDFSLHGNPISPVGVAAILKMLQTNRSLVKLNLMGTGISPKDITTIREALEKNMNVIQFANDLSFYNKKFSENSERQSDILRKFKTHETLTFGDLLSVKESRYALEYKAKEKTQEVPIKNYLSDYHYWYPRVFSHMMVNSEVCLPIEIILLIGEFMGVSNLKEFETNILRMTTSIQNIHAVRLEKTNAPQLN